AQVHQFAASVAKVRRAERRQNQIGPVGHSVKAQGLAEIFGLPYQPHSRCRIPKPADANQRVEQQSRGGSHRPLTFQLRQAVEQRWYLAEVAEEIAYTRAHEVRRDVAVTAHHRQHDPLIEPVVEVVHASVQRLPGIIDIQRLEAGTLELALIETWIEFQVSQWMSEAVLVDIRRFGMGDTARQQQEKRKQM